MESNSRSLRQRFDQLRAAMGWSWKDIDLITGRKNTLTNIAKRVPAWSILAIHAHESHTVLLQRHLIEIVKLHLGSNWRPTQLSDGVIAFHGTIGESQSVESLIIDFNVASFVIISSNSNIYEVTEKLKSLYPRQGDIFKNADGDFEIEIPIIL